MKHKYEVNFTTFLQLGYGVIQEVIEADNIVEATKWAVKYSNELEISNEVFSIIRISDTKTNHPHDETHKIYPQQEPHRESGICPHCGAKLGESHDCPTNEHTGS